MLKQRSNIILRTMLAAGLSAAVLMTAGGCRRTDICISGDGPISKEDRNVGNFSRIETDGSFTVFITEASVASVTVESESNLLPRIHTVTSGDRLLIETEGCFLRSQGIKVWVKVPRLDGVSLNGSGSVQGQNTFHTNDLDLVINGSGSMNMSVESQSIDTRVSGSGDIDLHGNTVNQKLSISGSGNYRAHGLNSQNADISISGSGNADVTVSNSIKASISGSGDITYSGTPTVDTEVSGSGKVRRR